jgi:putative DNA primase/helicase
MYEQVPEELKKLPQWVCWKSVPDDSQPGKIKKVPINPKTGGQAMSNNPDTWAGFQKAVTESHKYSGIGFMFASGYFGVDIDHAEDAIADYISGGMGSIVAEFIHTLQSYAEYSVSGKGIHILCRGSLPSGGRRRGNVEMYDSARFFVVTGKKAGEYADIAGCTDRIKPLHEKYIGGGQAPTTGLGNAEALNLMEEDILSLAGKSKQGKTFTDLYAGRWEAYFPSQSEADMALCNMLAFWTGRDEQMMDKLFRLSGLMRDKWLRKQSGSTYGAITVSKAAASCRNVYEHKGRFSVFQCASSTDKQRIEEQKDPAPVFYTFDDTGNAKRFTDRFGESVLYNYTAKKWMYYDGRRWVPDENGETKRMADEIVDMIRSGMQAYLDALPMDADVSAAKKEYVKHAKLSRSSKAKTNMLTESQHRVPVNYAQLDRHPSLLCVLNGELNLKTGSLQAHDKSHLITKIAHTEYTDKMDHPLWDKFLTEIFGGDKELIRYIQKAVGYSLTGLTQEHCAFFLYGTGRNGKSTFLDIITEMLGDHAVNIQPETIMLKQTSGGPTSDIARLKGARLVTTSEPNEGARINEGLLKQLTGGDKVTAALKYENEFEYTPEFKLWMCTNHRPFIRGTDVGIWSRIHLIPFGVQIPEEKMDRQLKFKLRKELPGILAWAVDGCLLWQREGLRPPESVMAAGREYKTEMDVLASFLDECCDEGGEVAAGELFRAYTGWAQQGNEYQMSGTKFGREMVKRYPKRRSGAWYYTGVHLRKECGPYQEAVGRV